MKIAQKRSIDLANGADFLRVFGGTPVSSGVTVNAATAQSLSAVYACVNKISSTISTLPLNLIEDVNGVKTHLSDHPIRRLINTQPNRNQNAYEFWDEMVACANYRGKAFARIHRNKNTALAEELEILDYSKVSIVDLNGLLMYKVSGYQLAVLPQDMLVISAHQGKSPIQIHKEGIGLGLATQQYGAKYFGEGGRLQGYWSTDNIFSTSEQREKNETAINAKTSGISNMHSTPLLDSGTKFHNISIPPDDAQFIETRQYQAKEVCQIFDVPPYMIHVETDVKYSNGEQADIEFTKHTLTPWCTRIEQEINRKLIPENLSGVYAKFNMNALMRGDMAARKEFYHTMLTDGVFNINEVRAFEDKNPIENGDKHLVQVNQITLDQIDKYAEKLSAIPPNQK